MLDLTNLQTIQSILRENGLKPRKGYGQNFMVAEQPLISLINAADIADDNVVVEIGPGLGVLTQELAKHAKLVLAIESDYQMVQWLRKYFKNQKNVKIIHSDILTYDLGLITNNYKVVSNLPYNITSPVIRKFLEANSNLFARQSQKDVRSIEAPKGLSMALATHFLRHDSQLYDKRLAISAKLDSMVLMVQKEVAERLTAKPGSADRGILTVMVELFAKAEIVEIVSRDCFWPVPKVDSAIIKLKIKDQKSEIHIENLKIDSKFLMKFVKVGFSQKRRQIHHPLSANLHLPSEQIKDILKSVGIDSTKRAEDLSLEEWIRLYQGINFH